MKKILLFCIATFMGSVLMTSCEKEDINTEITSEEINQSQPQPQIFEFKDISLKLQKARATNDATPIELDTYIWVKSDGSYFEKKGNEIIENTKNSDIINTYLVPTNYNDANYYIIQNQLSKQWIALPKLESINTAWVWNSANRSWGINDRDIKLTIQSHNDFELTLTSLTDTYARYNWNRNIFSSYTYDIFLNGIKIEEDMKDSRALYLFRRLPNSDTEYSAKIIAKGPNQEIRIKYLSFKTAKTINISSFEVEINNITASSVVLNWEEPIVSENLEVLYRVSITQWVTETFTQEDWDSGRQYWDLNVASILDFDFETDEYIYDDPNIIGREYRYLEFIDSITDSTATEFSTNKLNSNTEYNTLVEVKVIGLNNYEVRKAIHGKFSTLN